MKPLHIGLLAGGAVLAAGLAVKLSEPQTIPVVAAVERPIVPPVAARVPPVVIIPPLAKPSPIPRIPRVERAAAPEPVYDEPPKPAIRKNKANLVANIKPTQWTPGQYEARAATAQPAVPAVEPVAVEKKDPPAPASLPPAPSAPHQATLRTGMTIPIRLAESLSSDRTPVGGTFQALLAEPLAADGFVIAEKGARVTGQIVDSQKAGRFTGTSRLELGLTNLVTSDGQEVSISTDPWMKLGDSVPSETVIRFRLTSRVTITERQIAGR